MNLAIIRHGPAGDRAAWEAEGRDDRLRPLTPEGKKQMRRAAAGLTRLVPGIDVLASSPLIRARESAEVVAAEYGTELVTVDVLLPESEPEQTLGWLREQQMAQTVAVVGHEPHLSTLVGYLLTGTRASFITLKKAGACLLELNHPLKAGAGTLEWLLTPRVLRRLGE